VFKNKSSSDVAEPIQRKGYPQGSPFLWVIRKRVAAMQQTPFKERAIGMGGPFLWCFKSQ
jgi:hypothetical protein